MEDSFLESLSGPGTPHGQSNIPSLPSANISNQFMIAPGLSSQIQNGNLLGSQLGQINRPNPLPNPPSPAMMNANQRQVL